MLFWLDKADQEPPTLEANNGQILIRHVLTNPSQTGTMRRIYGSVEQREYIYEPEAIYPVQ